MDPVAAHVPPPPRPPSPPKAELAAPARVEKARPRVESSDQLVARANQVVEGVQLDVRFRVIPERGRVQIQMYDPISGAIIRNIPDTGLRDLMRRIEDLVGGMMVDRRA